MKQVALGETGKVISGATPKTTEPEYWGGNIPWVIPKEISRIDSPYISDSAQKITETGYQSCSTVLLPPNSLLLSLRAPIGLLAINKIAMCTSQGFKNLIPSCKVKVEYLYYCLKYQKATLQAKGNGATFKELSKGEVEKFKIPLPPLNDQIRINATAYYDVKYYSGKFNAYQRT